MKKQSLVFAALALAAAPAFGQTYDNGGMNPQNGGCNGGQYSAIEAPSSIYGNNTIVTSFHQADDFTVPGGQAWDPTSLKWYLYQSLSPANEPIVAVYIQVWRGTQADMLAGAGVLVGGDMTTNRLSGSSVFTNIYRTTASAPTNCDRAIKECTIDMTWLPVLQPGQYWIEIGSTGNPGYSGPWANHEVPRDGTENSIFYTVSTGAWGINVNSDQVTKWDYPFKLTYTSGGGCPSDFTATKSGTCPTASKITWSGAPNNSIVRVLYTTNNGSGGNIPSGPCAGTRLCIGLAGITLHSQTFNSPNGSGSTPNFAAPCGLNIQLITQTTCKTSNKVTL